MNAYEAFISGNAGYQELKTVFSGGAGDALDMIMKEMQNQIDQYLK
jgi:hypothetical protein